MEQTEEARRKNKHRIPPIGKRILKSSLGVLLCYVIYLLRGREGIPFYSMLAALWCIRPYIGNTLEMAGQRTLGTLTGAVYGLVLLLVRQWLLPKGTLGGELIYDLLVAAMIIPIIHTTLIMKHQNASYFSCVVFLSIVVNHVVDANPYFFAFQRVLDTMIGIIIGVGINSFHLPVKKQKDILFVSGIDDTLIEKNEQLSVYTKRELNYLLEDGVNFTISTMRTPASLQNVLDGVNLRLPIIAMDGAVLYDMKENAFIKTFVISYETAKELLSFIHSHSLHCFSNVIIDDCLLIYYDALENPAEQAVFDKLHTSPYRNYIHGEVPKGTYVVYFMLLDETERIQNFYMELQKQSPLVRLNIPMM